jgi:hypothetical protein
MRTIKQTAADTAGGITCLAYMAFITFVVVVGLTFAGYVVLAGVHAAGVDTTCHDPANTGRCEP